MGNNNNYDEVFINRLAFHFARTNSIPQCIPLLKAEFPTMGEFNKYDLNALRGRIRKNTGVDLLQVEREKYLEEVQGLKFTAMDNIRNGKDEIDNSMEILIEKLKKTNELIELAEPLTKEFNILLLTQKNLIDAIAKYTGIDDAMAVNKALAMSLLKQGKADEANEVITGHKKPQEDVIPQIMDGDYADSDDDDIEV